VHIISVVPKHTHANIHEFSVGFRDTKGILCMFITFHINERSKRKMSRKTSGKTKRHLCCGTL